jgi:predicted dinucleotide-binding enzyme
LSIQVGHSHATQARNIISSKRHPNLEIIPEGWRREQNFQDAFKDRVKLHNEVAKNSCTIVIQSIPYSYVEALRSQIGRDNIINTMINDMEVRADYTSGVAYVQYDQPHRDKVVEYVSTFLENYHLAQGSEEFPSPPILVDTA